METGFGWPGRLFEVGAFVKITGIRDIWVLIWLPSKRQNRHPVAH
jgi:hypothetical protein